MHFLHQSPEMWFFLCAVIVAASALMQALMLILVGMGVMRMRKRMQSLADRIEEEVLPTVKTARGILEETSPKVKLATDQLLEVSRTVRTQTAHINETLTDIVDKTHKQANRVDECLTTVLDGIGKAGDTVQRTTGRTSRKLSAAMTGIRVGMDVLLSRRETKAPKEKDAVRKSIPKPAEKQAEAPTQQATPETI